MPETNKPNNFPKEQNANLQFGLYQQDPEENHNNLQQRVNTYLDRWNRIKNKKLLLIDAEQLISENLQNLFAEKERVGEIEILMKEIEANEKDKEKIASGLEKVKQLMIQLRHDLEHEAVALLLLPSISLICVELGLNIVDLNEQKFEAHNEINNEHFMLH